ncbi:MAG: hypothetical protein KF703_07430 [Actinobacteria bacterium]|nr:hypothetical protein [Actinomycetota bacterium]
MIETETSTNPNSTLMGVGIIVALVLFALVGRAVLGGGGAGGDKAAFCSTYPQLAAAGQDGDTQEARAIVDRLAGNAPEASVRADAAVVVDGYDKVLGGNPLSVDEAKVTAAIDRIDAYAGRTCA